ncbi:MAG: cell division protein ZapE [Pseudomonadota bacterium]
MSLGETYRALIKSGELHEDRAQAELIPKFDKLLEALEEKPKSKGLFGRFSADIEPIMGLYIWGGVGRGKSMLMDLFYDHVQEPRKKRIHFHAFMQEVHHALYEARKTDTKDPILPVAKAIIAETRVLCFDEMQITDITDAMIVGRLFEKLLEAGSVVITTSNRPPDDLYKDGLNRDLFVPFIEQIKTHLEIYKLESPTDYRRNRLSSSETYFCPADAVASEKIAQVWSDLTGGKAAPHDIVVGTRKVQLTQFHNSMARAKFFDLCGNPLGPADYLALARAVRLLVLEDIPRLSRSNYNAAKRFVTLIDALYEAKVRLICSAADTPERLYVEGEGAFEFERTASRLVEMQSDDWAAQTG